MQSEHPNMAEGLRILARSPDVPSNGLGLRSGLPPETKNALRRALVEMQNDPNGRKVLDRFGALRFEVTTTDDYAPVFQFATQAGIDLATYQYLNE
jgi:ABC-type phosphate/phosphonate transport system substrate-binding protein